MITVEFHDAPPTDDENALTGHAFGWPTTGDGCAFCGTDPGRLVRPLDLQEYVDRLAAGPDRAAIREEIDRSGAGRPTARYFSC